jgi:hypothetical protein
MPLPYFFSGQVLAKDKEKSRFSDLKLDCSYLFRGSRNRKVILIRDKTSVLEAVISRNNNLVMASRYSSPTRNETGELGYEHLTLISDDQVTKQYLFYLRLSSRVKRLVKKARIIR